MMHVVIVSSGYPNIYEPLDGIFYRDQAEALSSKNINVGVISLVPVSFFSFLKIKKWRFGRKLFLDNNVKTSIWVYLNRPKSPLYPVRKAKKLGMKLFAEYVKQHGVPDLIHLHGIEGGELAISISEKYAIPFFVTEHSSKFLLNTLSPMIEPIAQNVFSKAKGRIAVSEFLKSTLEEKYGCEFHYVPNIVDTEIFTLSETIVKHDNVTFVHVAGLNANKNQKMLIKSFSQLHQKHPSIQLIIVGDGVLRNELQSMIIEYGLQENIQLLGYKNREELVQIYNESHAFVLSSIRETFGVVIIEAMSCGLPIVSTKCGGPQSILTKSYLGELAEITMESLSLAMEKVYENRSNYDSHKIREFAMENFSSEAVVEQLLKVYKQ